MHILNRLKSVERSSVYAFSTLVLQTKREYETSLERSGVPEPWLLVERLSEEILDSVLQATSFVFLS